MKKFELIKRFAGVRVLVVGDVMLDRYLIGSAGRISPEAPVPVVSLEKERLIAGGAANVAANVAGLGASVKLISVIGDDEEARQLKRVVGDSGIGVKGLIESKDRLTTVKTRLMAHSQQLARVDRESATSLCTIDAESLIGIFEEFLKKSDALLISDYGKGVVTEYTAERMISLARESGIPVFVDPKGIDYAKYKGASVLTPNKQEASEVFLVETRRSGTVEEAGRHILENIDIKELVITLGAEGMAVFPEKGGNLRLSASTRNVFDVTGAGDTVIAVLAVAKASGADLETACQIANTAAGLVVEEVGTTAISFSDLKAALEGQSSADKMFA